MCVCSICSSVLVSLIDLSRKSKHETSIFNLYSADIYLCSFWKQNTLSFKVKSHYLLWFAFSNYFNSL